MTSYVVDAMLKIDKTKEEYQINAAEKEAKAIVDGMIEDIINWSKNKISGKVDGFRFNSRNIRIVLSQFTTSTKGNQDFCESHIASSSKHKEIKVIEERYDSRRG